MVMFSIIIPVYNVKAYIKECLDSVAEQTYTDFEAILIDDGSKDDSGKICDEYCKNDHRFKVIHKRNSGVSAARNDGIAVSEGKYLLFLDSDDYLDPSALQILYDAIYTDNCEMYLFGYNSFVNGTKEFRAEILNGLSNLSYDNGSVFAIKAVQQYDWLPSSAWCVAVQRSFVIKHEYRFDTELIYGEDADFSLRCLIAAKSVRYLPVAILCFRSQREGSASAMMSCKHIKSSFNYCTNMYHFFAAQKNTSIAQYFANKSANTVYRICRIINKSEAKELSLLFAAEKDMISQASGAKYKVARLVWLLLGYKTGSKLLHFVNMARKK